MPDGSRVCRTEKRRHQGKNDYMHSFVLAETLKYFYLVFAPPRERST
ncbi:MAG: glycoside hydrolase family 47 protein [Acidobacteria bacterium]|nr:glycoside hydrolase family 47 protein [Acidobacteriota bacterium]